MSKVEQLAEQLVALNVTELIEFKKVLKEKYGIEEVIPVVAAPVTIKEEPKVVEKTHVSIVLTKVSEVTTEKLNAVKAINRLINVGLKPAMDLTKVLPSIITDSTVRADAEAFKNELAALNCEVEFK